MRMCTFESAVPSTQLQFEKTILRPSGDQFASMIGSFTSGSSRCGLPPSEGTT